jgi:hypothetical protein
MELHDLQEQWSKQLDVAETFLPNEPMAALDATRAVTLEIEHYVREAPYAREDLAQLLARARAALARSQTLSARWQANAAARGHHHQRRELELAALPMRAMRSPWPPRVSE